MQNDWISSNDEICADNYNFFEFKFQGRGRSEMWEVYLYGGKTIKVDRDSAEVLSRGAPPLGIDGVGFAWQRITPSTSCACLPSVAWE